jgi:hypothetical protein
MTRVVCDDQGTRRLHPADRWLPGVACALCPGIRLHRGPPTRTRLLALADRRETGARRRDRWTEAGGPGRLERTLFASLRRHRVHFRNTLRQRRRGGGNRARLPVRTLAARAARRRRRLPADGGGAIRPHTRHDRGGTGCCHHGPSRLANAGPAAPRAMARGAVRVRPAGRADGADGSGAGRRTLP